MQTSSTEEAFPVRKETPKTVRTNAERKRRRQLAAMAKRAAAPERPLLGRGPRYLIQPSVSFACGPVLSEIARNLRDGTLPIDSAVLDEVASFLSGPSSRRFERSPDGALDEAVRLAHVQRQRKTDARIDPPEDEITNVPVLESHLRA
jgi:hypothetical protein